ncbi:MAG: cell wall-active antibiotics response protein LiaF, partial [Chloroflexota bacterium]
LWGTGRWRAMGPFEKVVGDIRMGEEEWELRDTETSLGIGDLRLDLRRARIPAGETTIRIKGGIADIKVVVPQGLAVSAQGQVGMGSINLLGHKADGVSRQLSFSSPDYASAEKKVKIHTSLLIGDTSIVRRE